MKHLPWLLAALLCTVALAGCSDAKKASVDDVEFDGLGLEATPDTGIVRGVVVDASVTPVAGADVTIELLGKTTQTGENGAFGFDGLAPGDHFLRVSKLGYLTTQQSVRVEANVAEPPVVKVLLERDPAATPFLQVFKFDGFLECSFSLILVLFAACGVLPEDVSNNEFLVEYTFDDGLAYVQSEVLWDSTQALGDELSVGYDDLSGAEQRDMNGTSGKSPLVVVLDAPIIQEFALANGTAATFRVFADDVDETDAVPIREVQQAYNESAPQPVRDVLGQDCIMWPTLFDACIGAGGIGIVANQEFTVFTHAFYHFLPETGWQFSMHGDPPVPDL